MKPEIVIIHHSLTKDSGTVSAQAIRKYHTEVLGWTDCGYHAIIEMVGDRPEIIIGRMMNEQGAHTRRHNRNSYGLCFVGNYDKDEVPPKMWHLGVRFVASLCDVLNIETRYIFAHNEFSNYKTCPGKNFSVLGFQANVRDLLNT